MPVISVTWSFPGLSVFKLLLAAFNLLVKPDITPCSYSFLDILFSKAFT